MFQSYNKSARTGKKISKSLQGFQLKRGKKVSKPKTKPSKSKSSNG